MRFERVKKKIIAWQPRNKFIHFLKWVFIDLYRCVKYGRRFNEYGLTMFCGLQGCGKTTAMVEYLERMRKKYPAVLIVTNFGYLYENMPLNGWEDLLTIRNGLDGVIFAIDEIQNEFSSASWKDFPETLLSEITQQRKQRIKIVCTSQHYTRVVKQLREQCSEVADCRTFLGRWTRVRVYDAFNYETFLNSGTIEKRFKVPRKKSYSFIQTDEFRNLFDSFKKIDRIVKLGFVEKK